MTTTNTSPPDDKALDEVDKRFAGCWFCPQCNFTLQKSILSAKSGGISPNNEPFNEICPNDGQLMHPMTLSKAYDGMAFACETQVKRAVAAEQERDQLTFANQKLQAELDGMKKFTELFKNRATHSDGCEWWRLGGDECSCGFTFAMDEYKTLTQTKESKE